MPSPSHPATQSTPPPAPPSSAAPTAEPLYGGYTRFELELEFTTLLTSPAYLTHLAASKLLHDPAFIRYISYLSYWTTPPYITYLSRPGPTLRVLELLREERFRNVVGGIGVVEGVLGGGGGGGVGG